MNRRFLATAVAAALAVLGIVLVMAYVGNATKSAINKARPVRVLAVTQPIQAGITGSAAISGGLVHMVREPRGTLPPGYVRGMTRQESLEVFTSALEPGQIVTANMFGPRSQTSSPLIVPGQGDVDVGIAVCQVDALAGEIGPGAHVEIVNTASKDPAHPLAPSCQAHQSTAGGARSKPVLPDVVVRAVIDTAPPPTSPTETTPAATPAWTQQCDAVSQGEECVIVSVTKAQALTLEAANTTGQLALFLLND